MSAPRQRALPVTPKTVENVPASTLQVITLVERFSSRCAFLILAKKDDTDKLTKESVNLSESGRDIWVLAVE